MDPVYECKRIVEAELAQHNFEVREVAAIQSTAGQILAQVRTNDGRTAKGTEQGMCEAIWRAHQAGIPLEEEFDACNMYS